MQLRFGPAVEEPEESHTPAVINEWTRNGQDVQHDGSSPAQKTAFCLISRITHTEAKLWMLSGPAPRATGQFLFQDHLGGGVGCAGCVQLLESRDPRSACSGEHAQCGRASQRCNCGPQVVWNPRGQACLWACPQTQRFEDRSRCSDGVILVNSLISLDFMFPSGERGSDAQGPV